MITVLQDYVRLNGSCIRYPPTAKLVLVIGPSHFLHRSNDTKNPEQDSDCRLNVVYHPGCRSSDHQSDKVGGAVCAQPTLTELQLDDL